MSPLEAAERLKNGETLKMNFENRNQKHDFDYEVLKKLLDLFKNDMKAASRALCCLKSKPLD